jgi:hypothetical protein
MQVFVNNISHVVDIIWLINNNPDVLDKYIVNIYRQAYDFNMKRVVKTDLELQELEKKYENDLREPCPVSEVCKCGNYLHKPKNKPFMLFPKKPLDWFDIIKKVDFNSSDLLFEFFVQIIKPKFFIYDISTLKKIFLKHPRLNELRRVLINAKPVVFEPKTDVDINEIIKQIKLDSIEMIKMKLRRDMPQASTEAITTRSFAIDPVEPERKRYKV